MFVKVFKNGPSKVCGRRLFKNLKRYRGRPHGLPLYRFKKVVFQKCYLVHP